MFVIFNKIQVLVEEPRPKWRGFFLPKEKIFVIRPLTPRQVAGNAQAVAFNQGFFKKMV
jgi:hypothetical protein